MASGYVKCSCSIRKATALPPLPELKSFHICLTGDTMNEGDFSLLNGLSPLRLLPARFSTTKSPITSSTRAVSNTVSMELFEINIQAIGKVVKLQSFWSAKSILLARFFIIQFTLLFLKFHLNSIIRKWIFLQYILHLPFYL